MHVGGLREKEKDLKEEGKSHIMLVTPE